MKRQRLETVDTLAERFGLPRRTIEREVMRCRLPYVSVAGNWRFRERDIELWLERAGGLPRLQLLRGGREDRLPAMVQATEAESGSS
ncbi:MAG TPA: helix-turn-helix domain-containing protein [Acidobacteriota bacterium]|nr:helix-turn-helix domain-containing protein [Acidobacteriota bacterium]